MLSYLPLDEPSWLSGAPEPNSRHKSGTCRECDTTHYNGPDEVIEMSPCSCGTAMCCESCERCAECGDPVCQICSIDTSRTSRAHVVCAGCHQVYLDEIYPDDANTNEADTEDWDAPYLDSGHVPPQALHPLIAIILDSFRGVRS